MTSKDLCHDPSASSRKHALKILNQLLVSRRYRSYSLTAKSGSSLTPQAGEYSAF